MIKYLDLLNEIIDTGIEIKGRNGIVKTIFGAQLKHNLFQEGFPALTTKKLAFNAVKGELLGFLRAYTNIEDFKKIGCNVWDANANDWSDNGDLGRIYGVQWRQWRSVIEQKNNYEIIEVDQIKDLIHNIKHNPFSRRHILNAWNPGELNYMALPPCHILAQFHVVPENNKPKFLSVALYQRSADAFLGVPFNIASYSLLLCMVAQVTGLIPLNFIHFIGNLHIYEQHYEAVKIQLERTPYKLPELYLNKSVKDIDDFKTQDIKLRNYRYHDTIKAKMIV